MRLMLPALQPGYLMLLIFVSHDSRDRIHPVGAPSPARIAARTPLPQCKLSTSCGSRDILRPWLVFFL